MNKRELRKNIFYAVFQLYFAGKEEQDDVLRVFFKEYQFDEESKKIINDEVMGIMEHAEELDSEIESYAKGWKISRMSKVDRAILRVALYEMKYVEDIPVGVAINEAIELSKKYSTDESPAFINGILGKIARSGE